MAEQRRTYRVSGTSVDELNFILSQLSDRLDQMEGYRGTPSLKSSLDMGGNLIQSIATPAAGSDAASKDYADAIKIPVGYCIMSVVATNPADALGYGTWEQIAQGQFLVGQSDDDANYSDPEATGGSDTHTHSIDPPATNTGGPSATVDVTAGAVAVASDTHIHALDVAAFDSNAGSSVPPFFVVYVWKRTA